MDPIHALGASVGFLLAGVSAVAVAILSFSMHYSYEKLRRGTRRGKDVSKTASRAHAQLVFCGIFALWAVAPLVAGSVTMTANGVDVISLTTVVVGGAAIAAAAVSSVVYARRFDRMAPGRA